MQKANLIHSNHLEILFWDCVFHCVKMIHKVNVNTRLTIENTLDNRWKLFILAFLFNTGLFIGLILGYIHNL